MSSTIVQPRRELRAEARKRQAETLPRLRAALQRARQERVQRLRDARTRCTLEAAKNRQQIAEARARLRDWAKETFDRGCAACRLLKWQVKEEALGVIDAALLALEAQRTTISKRWRKRAHGSSSSGNETPSA